jgi:hypothetical protein
MGPAAENRWDLGKGTEVPQMARRRRRGAPEVDAVQLREPHFGDATGRAANDAARPRLRGGNVRWKWAPLLPRLPKPSPKCAKTSKISRSVTIRGYIQCSHAALSQPQRVSHSTLPSTSPHKELSWPTAGHSIMCSTKQKGSREPRNLRASC